MEDKIHQITLQGTKQRERERERERGRDWQLAIDRRRSREIQTKQAPVTTHKPGWKILRRSAKKTTILIRKQKISKIAIPKS